MTRSAAFLALSVACGRSAGPRPGETVAWVIEDAEVTADGCDQAAPVVAAVERTNAAGAGFVYRVTADGRRAEGLFCPILEGAFDLGACEPDGVFGSIRGSKVSFEREEVLVDDEPCAFVLREARVVTDQGADGTFQNTVEVEVVEDPRCAYTFEGEVVQPGGCAVAVSAALAVSDWAR